MKKIITGAALLLILGGCCKEDQACVECTMYRDVSNNNIWTSEFMIIGQSSFCGTEEEVLQFTIDEQVVGDDTNTSELFTTKCRRSR